MAQAASAMNFSHLMGSLTCEPGEAWRKWQLEQDAPSALSLTSSEAMDVSVGSGEVGCDDVCSTEGLRDTESLAEVVDASALLQDVIHALQGLHCSEEEIFMTVESPGTWGLSPTRLLVRPSLSRESEPNPSPHFAAHFAADCGHLLTTCNIIASDGASNLTLAQELLA